MKKNEVWGNHPMENTTAFEWSKETFQPVFAAIKNSSSSSKTLEETRVASFWLGKLGQWMGDVAFISKMIDDNLRLLNRYLDSDKVEFEIKLGIKEQIRHLETLKRELKEDK